MPSVSVHIGVLVIAKDPARPDLAAVEVVAGHAAATGHRVIARQSIPDTESAIRSQLARWMDDREIDVIVVLSAESEVISKALKPLVTEAIPGFTDLFRWLAFQEAGASAMLSAAESARCGSTFVFVVPGAIGPAMDKLILPQFDPATTPRNLVDQIPRLKAKSPDAVPMPITAEKTQGGSGLPARLPAVSEGMRTRPRTGANIVSRPPRAPSDPDTKPIDVAKLERQLERSMTPSHEDVTRPDLSLKLPRVPHGAADTDDDDDEALESDDHTMTDTVAVQPAPPLPPAGPVTVQPRKRPSDPPRTRPPTSPPRVPSVPSVAKPDSGGTPAVTATPVGGVPALPARGPNVPAQRESKPFSFSTPLRGGSAAPGRSPPPRTGAPPARESWSPTSTSTGTGAYRDSARPGAAPPRESTSAGTPAYSARGDAPPATPAAPPPPEQPARPGKSVTTPPAINRWARPAGATTTDRGTSGAAAARGSATAPSAAPASNAVPTPVSSAGTTRTAGGMPAPATPPAAPTSPAALRPISATPTARTASPAATAATPALSGAPTTISATPTARTSGGAAAAVSPAPATLPAASTPPLASRPPAGRSSGAEDEVDDELLTTRRSPTDVDDEPLTTRRSTTDVDDEPATNAKRSTTDVDDEPDDESWVKTLSATKLEAEGDDADSWAKTRSAAEREADRDAAASWAETVSAAKVDLDAETIEPEPETIEPEPETIDAEPDAAPPAVTPARSPNAPIVAAPIAAAPIAAAPIAAAPIAAAAPPVAVAPPHVAPLPTLDSPRPRIPTGPPPVRAASTAKAADDELPRGAFTYPVKPRRGNLVLTLVLSAAALAGSFFAVVYFLDKGDASKDKAASTTPPAPIDAAVVAVAPADAALVTDDPEIEMGSDDPAPARGSAATRTTTGANRVRPVPTRGTTATGTTGTTTTTTTKPDAGATTTTTTATTPEPAPEPTPEADLCDEANCVLSDYDRPCCQKYKARGPEIAQRVGGVPETLDRSMVRAGVETIKPRVIACGEKSGVKGTVKVSVAVSPDGAVTSSEVQDAPDAALGSCVATALKSAKFKKSVEGGSFTYPFVF